VSKRETGKPAEEGGIRRLLKPDELLVASISKRKPAGKQPVIFFWMEMVNQG
jgi:hypothetical protein